MAKTTDRFEDALAETEPDEVAANHLGVGDGAFFQRRHSSKGLAQLVYRLRHNPIGMRPEWKL